MKRQEHEHTKRLGKNQIRVLLIVIGIVLFKTFVWDEYIVNPTAGAALDGEAGEPGVMHVISKKQEFAIRPYEEGFKIYAVSKGFWGWSVTDEMFIGNETKKSFEPTFQFKRYEKLYVSLVVDREQSLEEVAAHSTNVGSINFNKIAGDNADLYYHFSDEPLGGVTYEGTHRNGKTEILK
ncbi:hypothetical protein [Sporosarcina sp. Marseille-Q4943]|uniref:hypothetical protein n=1 Tax=Sporosarcina sp. Marseille-Q4943 TaxID=2942204 RepID=UPI00208DBA64|nr:hypothetical protein [Sporosarcina sp. Marseille-Q4943]